MKKIVAIIQARVGSTRLPGKVLLDLKGKTVINHVVDRVKKSKYIDEVIVATTDLEQDNKIVDECNKIGCKYFRGSESDVLSRYYLCAKENDADIIIRITSDCPLIDFNIIDNMIKKFLHKQNSSIDYMNNTLEPTLPRGYDVEIFSFRVLAKANIEAKLDYEREHVTPYIYFNPDKFNLSLFKYRYDYSRYRLTLDTKEDFEVISSIFESLYDVNNYFLLKDVIKYMEYNPEIVQINKNIEQKKLGE